MLVLTRKCGEWIQISEDVRVYIMSARNGRASVAIEAPREVAIVRGELVEREARTNDAA